MSKKHAQILLDKLRRELQRVAQSPVEERDLSVERFTDPLDEADARTNADMAVAYLNASWQTVKAIEEAIDRVKSGEYGLCQACGEPIPPKRLRAIPWAPYCVPCQQEAEAQEERKIA